MTIKVGDSVRFKIEGSFEDGDGEGVVLQETRGPIDGMVRPFYIVQLKGRHRNASPAVLLEEILEVNGEPYPASA